jgi:predicted RecB family nuclease
MTTDRLLTPTRITGWLGCAHTLTAAREAGDDFAPTYGSLARLLQEKGETHERAHLDRLRVEGRTVLEVPRRADDETFASWADRCRGLLAEGHDVLYQFPLVHDGVRGIADFLERVDVPSDLGAFSYEPVDAKLARSDAKPGHVLQLCFYADALAALQGVRPRTVHLELGSGERETIVLATVDAYWRRVRGRIARAIENPEPTVAKRCAHCDQCAFAPICEAEWRGRDALHFIAGVRSVEVERIEADGVRRLTAFAHGDGPIADVRAERITDLRRQAALQVASRGLDVPVWELRERPEEGSAEELAARLPAPDEGDVFLDLEGHPFWRADVGLFFLFGALVRDADAPTGWTFRAWWAHDEAGEAAAVAELIDWLAERRLAHPGMHVLHYNHTERSALTSLADRHGARPELLTALVDQGVFVDLLEVVRRTVRIGAESYSLKQVELVAGYERGHEIDEGAGAVVGYERWMRDGDASELDAIARYNEDDVRATLAVRTWLLDEVLVGVPPRPAPEPVEVEERELDVIIAALLERDEDWLRLLGHLLGYWAREDRTATTQALAQLEGDERELMERPEVISGLRLDRIMPPPEGRRSKVAYFAYPPGQTIGFDVDEDGQRVIFRYPDGMTGSRAVVAIDRSRSEIAVRWPRNVADDGMQPTAVVRSDLFLPGHKRTQVIEFAKRLLADDTDPSDAARIALLRRTLPKFRGELGPGPEGFPSDADALAPLAVALHDGVLAVQGPPGTGKTHTGAALIAALVAAGKKVGVTAFSNAAIDNLLRKVAREHPEVRVMRKGEPPETESLRIPGAQYVAKAEQWDPAGFDVLGGTTWVFAHPALSAGPAFDVLVIDEAGQMGLADALAAMSSARSVILLGDPLQLSQVSVATHPDGSGRSCLEHVLGGAATMPPERGVFLETTRRMHPTITRFLSEHIYDGRLLSHPDCERRTVDGEAGIRWRRVEHSGCTVESSTEASAVHELVASLIGRTLMDVDGSTRSLTPDDVMVVAPFNRQVRLVQNMLDGDDRTRGTRVGTVDRFQGQERPVVIFSMTSSSGEDLTRGIDFLFSRHRLNVAVSRAQCLAYVFCTDELLDTRATDVDTMQLIGTLCALVEVASAAASHR